MSNSPDRPNPLPMVGGNAEIERASVAALCELTDGSNVLFREMPGKDYGIDAILEVKIGQHATNFVAHVQLKGAECASFNSDGTISRQIDVSNLNYLLNGVCALYVFYSKQHNQLWYAWATDEARRLENENPEWLSQQTVTIRFSKTLDRSDLQEIIRRIVEENQCRRNVIDALARQATPQAIKVEIDPVHFQTTDPDEAYGVLVNEGFTLLAKGMWKEVLSKFDLLPPLRKKEPYIQLTLAYAHFVQGRCMAALACCGEAQLRKSELKRSDQEILKMIRDACDCQLGKISRAEYTQRQAAAAAADNSSIQCRLEAARFVFLSERNESRRDDCLKRFRVLAEEVLSDPSSGQLLKLQTRVHAAYLEGFQAQLALSQSLGNLYIQKTLNQPWARPDLKAVVPSMAKFVQWATGMDSIIREAESVAVPWILAEARRTALLVHSAMAGFKRFLHKLMGFGEGPTATELQQLIVGADHIAAGFNEAGNIEMEMRAKIAKADILEVAEDFAGARAIAEDVLPVADALGLAETAELARQHLAGSTLLQRTDSEIRKEREDRDGYWASVDDGAIDFYAERCLSVSQLPRERLPIIRKDVEAMRIIARQRLNWCRHLEQMQMLAHTRTAAAAYASPTLWLGQCLKHRIESPRSDFDFEIVIEQFKKTYCQECPDRDPKNKTTT